MTARQPCFEAPRDVQVRGVAPGDRWRVASFLAAMDRDGLYDRHFAHGEAPNQALLNRVARLDQGDRAALAALDRRTGMVAYAEYVAEQGAAEFAMMVLPSFRRQGVGARLLDALIGLAAVAGQQRMVGMIRACNSPALRLAQRRGFEVVPGDDPRVVLVSRELTPVRDAAPARPLAADWGPGPLILHDTDRTPLHRRPGPGTPLSARRR